MRKLFLALVAAVATLLSASPAAAHDEIAVVGVVKAVTATTLEINTKEGQTVTLEMDANTRVAMADKRLTVSDIKPGQSVKALGYGDSLKDLIVFDVVISTPAKGG